MFKGTKIAANFTVTPRLFQNIGSWVSMVLVVLQAHEACVPPPRASHAGS